MQYALIALGEHRILVDACELSVLNAWREYPITERDDFDEEAHDFHVCYGGYLLNPATPAADIHEKLAQQADHWLSAVTTGESACRQIGLCALRTFPLVTAGHQNIVPFAALIKADEDVIGNIAGASTFAVTAFLRVHDWDVATNILNRAGLYALNGVERRHKQPVDKTNWEQCIDAERANRIARRLLKCGNHE